MHVATIFNFPGYEHADHFILAYEAVESIVGEIVCIEQTTLLIGFAHQHFLDFQKQAWLFLKERDNFVR